MVFNDFSHAVLNHLREVRLPPLLIHVYALLLHC